VAEESTLNRRVALCGEKAWMSRGILLSEKDLLLRIQKGDREAYGEVVKKHMRPAYFIALGFIHNPQDALDISQDAFVRAFRSISRFDAERPFFPWLYRILKNLCLDHLKKSRHHLEIPLEGMQLAGKEKEDRDVKEILWKGITELPFEQREVIILRYFQQYSYKEIADITSKPVGTVMSSLHGAKKKLRGILKKYLGSGEMMERF